MFGVSAPRAISKSGRHAAGPTTGEGVAKGIASQSRNSVRNRWPAAKSPAWDAATASTRNTSSPHCAPPASRSSPSPIRWRSAGSEPTRAPPLPAHPLQRSIESASPITVQRALTVNRPSAFPLRWRPPCPSEVEGGEIGWCYARKRLVRELAMKRRSVVEFGRRATSQFACYLNPYHSRAAGGLDSGMHLSGREVGQRAPAFLAQPRVRTSRRPGAAFNVQAHLFKQQRVWRSRLRDRGLQ